MDSRQSCSYCTVRPVIKDIDSLSLAMAYVPWQTCDGSHHFRYHLEVGASCSRPDTARYHRLSPGVPRFFCPDTGSYL